MKQVSDTRYFERYGLKRIVNAYETLTKYSGSILNPIVLEEMYLASTALVDMSELQRALAAKIIAMTGHEGAFICAGGAAGIVLSMGACMVKGYPYLSNELPRRVGINEKLFKKYEVLIHKSHRNPYDHAVLIPGAKLVEFGLSSFRTKSEQMERAFTENTAAVLYCAGKIFERYSLPLEITAEIAHKNGVPVIVDAAALLPPVENLCKYTNKGADLVIFSGGKGLRGPQDTGLILGDKELIDCIEVLASPHQGFGRSMKTTKESLAGFFAAFKLFLETDWNEVYQQKYSFLQKFLEHMQDVPNIDTRIDPVGRHGQQYPRAIITFKGKSLAYRDALIATLEEDSNPIILVGPLDEEENSIAINAFSLNEDDMVDLVVGIKKAIEKLSKRSIL